MSATICMELPGWTKEGLTALTARCDKLKVQLFGPFGEFDTHEGFTYEISNKHCFGSSEVELVQNMIDGVNTLFKEDLVLQKKHSL